MAYVTYIIGVNAYKSSYPGKFQWFNVDGNGSIIGSATLNDFQAFVAETNTNFYDNPRYLPQVYLLDNGKYYQTTKSTNTPSQVNEPSGDNILALISYSVPIQSLSSYNSTNDLTTFFASSAATQYGWTPTGLILYGLGKLYNSNPSPAQNMILSLENSQPQTAIQTIQMFYPTATIAGTSPSGNVLINLSYDCGCRTVAMNISRMFGGLKGGVSCLNDVSLVAGRKPAATLSQEIDNKNKIIMLLLILSILFFISMLIFLVLYITSVKK